MRQCFASLLLLVAALTFSNSVRADPQSEARALKEESLKILKDIANRDATPEELAKCIYNLEKAAALLEAAHDADGDLATEINGELYWARKRSTLAMDAVLDKMRASGGGKVATPAPAPKKVEPPKPAPKADPAEPTELQPGMEAATKAFNDAEKFAKAHAEDDYVVGVHWFQMASLHPGTDLSLKALSLARDAQARFQSKSPNAKKEELPETAEMKPLKEADALVAQKQFDKAIPLYQSSIKIKDTKIAHQRLGKAYYEAGNQVKEGLLKQYTEIAKEYNAARANAFTNIQIRGVNRRIFNPKDPAYVAALAKCNDYNKQAAGAYTQYDKAREEFKTVLRMAPGGKDLVSDGLIGICLTQKKENLSTGKSHLAKFVKEYTPANDDERSIYEYCKTELERVMKF